MPGNKNGEGEGPADADDDINHTREEKESSPLSSYYKQLCSRCDGSGYDRFALCKQCDGTGRD